VRYYEVWNEVDQNIFWTGTERQYLAAPRACAQAIRAVQPGAKIVLAGLTSLNADWISALNRMGGKGLYDVVAFHTYAEAPWDSSPVEALTTPGSTGPYSYAWSWEVASDHGRLPVWMNEGGATTASDFVDSEYSQATWVRRMVGTQLAWLHEPDGTVRRVKGFDGKTIPNVEVRASAIPLLYEISPAGR